jgi:hypothetical protein
VTAWAVFVAGVVVAQVLLMAGAAWVQVMNGHLPKQRAAGLVIAVLIVPVAVLLARLLA